MAAMRTTLVVIVLAALVFPVLAQTPSPTAQAPSPEAQAFARLPAELRAALGHLPPQEALQKLQFARQNLIALGVANPSSEQLRATVARVLGPDRGPVESASAGASSFPPLSPLVSPQAPLPR
jgi:hypothetical protein